MCSTSRASSAPRRVGLMPTSVAPETAHAPSANHISGVLSNSTPTWKGASTGFRSSRNAARCAIASSTSRYVHDESSKRNAGASLPMCARNRSAMVAGAVIRAVWHAARGYQLPPPPPPPPPPENPPPLKPLLLDDVGWLA